MLPPGLARLAGRLFEEGPRPAGRHQDQASLLEGVYWLIWNVCHSDAEPRQPAPLLLSIDDADWADAASLRLIVRVGVRLADLPVVVVMAARPPAHDVAHEPLAALRVTPCCACCVRRH